MGDWSGGRMVVSSGGNWTPAGKGKCRSVRAVGGRVRRSGQMAPTRRRSEREVGAMVPFRPASFHGGGGGRWLARGCLEWQEVFAKAEGKGKNWCN